MDAVEGEVVLVSDATGELGRELVRAALSFGAARVYACGPRGLAQASPRVVPVVLDADSDASLGRLRRTTTDATVLVHTGSPASWPPVALSGGDAEALRRQFAHGVIRPLRVAASLAPTLAANGGGVIACAVSVQAWINLTGAFGVAQSALWSALNALRLELRASGVHVLAAVGAFDEGEAFDARAAAEAILVGVGARAHEVVLDAFTADVRARLSGPVEGLYPELRG